MGFTVAALGAIIQWNFWEWLSPNRFIVFFPVVIITSLLGGLGAGIAGTLFSTLFAIYFFFPPLYSFEIEGHAGFAPVLLFVFSGITVAIMNHILKRRQIKLREIELLRDMDQQKIQLMDFLKESEEKFRALTESIPQMVWTTTSSGMLDYCNQRWLDYTGMSLEETQNMGWRRALHPEDQNNITSIWTTDLKKGTPYEMECRILRASDSTYRWHLGRGIPFCDQSGLLIKWFGTFTDIQDQKAAMEKVNRALEIRDEFLSIVSHELKTPMTTLKIQIQRQQRLLANYMEGSNFPTDDLWPMIEESDLQIERMKRLVNDMLDVSRMNFEQLSLHYEKFNLVELIKNIVERFTQQCQMSGCTLILKPSESVFGEWDRGRIEQVISNLIINAIKYGKKSPITISLEKKPMKVLIQVHDQGIGISEKDQVRIFNRFERAVASDSPISGLGLGLYIVKRIVELHKGHIEVQSEINKGTTFSVTLPL